MINKYEQVVCESRTINEKNDCAVIAVTLVTGKKYEDVHDMFRRAGRKRGKGTPMHITMLVLEQLGYRWEVRRGTPKTVNQCEQKLSKNSKWLILTSRHLLAMTDGVVHDWMRGRKHQPKSIYRVVRRRRKS